MSKDTKHFLKSEILNYLENEKKYNGQKDFITYIDFQVDDGKASMWQYDIFPGIQLLISDFETSSCFRNVNKQDVITINHCHIGRFECMFDKQNIIYMGEGDIAISSMNYQVKQSSIPLKRFYGASIIIFPEIAEQNAFLQELGISFRRLSDKYSLEDSCHVFRRNEEIEHIYDEIYEQLENPELAFLKIKLAELLFRFQAKEITLEENHTYLSKQMTDKIKHVKEHLEQELDEKVGLQELAKEHGLSLTQLKANFKEIYGVSPYAYAKTYKMNVAAKMLVETDERIGDIALELSYKNPSKFADAFESVMGCSPSEYRKRYSKT